MKTSIEILIVSDGYSGLIVQNFLQSLDCNESFIVRKGHKKEKVDRDAVIFSKTELPITINEPFNINISKETSGSELFYPEYTEKVYNKKIKIVEHYDREDVKSYLGYEYDHEEITKDSMVYGNMEITYIDIENKIAYGKILNTDADIEIKYSKLVYCNSIHKIGKLTNVNLLKKFGLFITYFPIGINRIPSFEHYNDMDIVYYSDPNIPFYRKQYFRNNIFYEYCLNKPYNTSFDFVMIPGRFEKVKDEIMLSCYEYFMDHDIYFVGRFATWNPDFLLEHIYTYMTNDSSSVILTKLYGEL